MDVKSTAIGKMGASVPARAIDARQRRALARLGLASAGAYVAPILLTLRSTAATAMPAADIGAAA
jgi:hypothetical protein